jgi:hypothetical protein
MFRPLKRFFIKVRLVLGFRSLAWIEKRHQALGWSRHRRKAFWHGFVNWPESRKSTIKFFISQLMKNKIKGE